MILELLHDDNAMKDANELAMVLQDGVIAGVRRNLSSKDSSALAKEFDEKIWNMG